MLLVIFLPNWTLESDKKISVDFHRTSRDPARGDEFDTSFGGGELTPKQKQDMALT